MIDPMRRALAFATALGLAIFPLNPATAQDVTVTLDQARGIAQAALSRGEPVLAMRIVQGLLQANPRDAHALLIASAAQAQLKDYKAGRKAAAQAYRNTRDRHTRLRAAQFAARLSLQEDRPTLTQIWLRRAALNVASESDKDRIAKDYAQVRAYNPWSFSLGMSLRPSSNVNNGADSAEFVIDGVPGEGRNNPESQALSGMILRSNVKLQYRLHGDARSRTTVGSRLRVQRVRLSSDARADSPTSENSDFGSTYWDMSLNHAFAIGDRKGDAARVSFSIGRYWYGDERNYDVLRLDGGRSWQVSDSTSYGLSFSAARHDDADNSSQDYTILGLAARLSHERPQGDRIGVTLAYQDTSSDTGNKRSDGWSLRANYKFAKQLGPAEVTAALTLANTHFPDYRVPFIPAPIVVPGGRKDESIYADLRFFFRDYDYAGFAPEMNIRLGGRSSNVSSFETREFSVGFGIQSKF